MKLKRSGAAVGFLAAGALLISACGSDNNGSTATGGTTVDAKVCAGKQKLAASGSSAQKNAMERFIANYEASCDGFTLDYNPTGSGQGVSDFLAGLKVSNRTRNAYATTLKCVFECARRRGQFTGDDPFDGMKAKVAGSSYQPFTVAELQTLFNSMPREVEPKKHTPDTALPWVALIAAFSGMRLEEIAQLKTSDIREEGVNGGRLWCIDIHNGGENKLKNETSARLIPVHSALVHAGLLAYVKALPKGPLFPGLVCRESKGGKVGARLGELFRKKLVTLKLKRDGLCFHSFRHTVATALRRASVPQEDAARVLGHAVEGESYGTYAQAGPELIDVKATVEKIKYEGAAPLAQNEVGETT